MNKQQRGDAMTVVLVILVIVLAVALGFIAWQSYTKKETDKKQETTQTEQPKVEERVVTMDKWGVEVPLGDDTTAYTTEYSEADGVARYTLKATVQGSCTAVVGQVVKADSAQATDTSAKVGDQTYLFVSPQQAGQCDGGAMPTAEQAKAAETASNNFRDNLFSKLRATKQS